MKAVSFPIPLHTPYKHLFCGGERVLNVILIMRGYEGILSTRVRTATLAAKAVTVGCKVWV